MFRSSRSTRSLLLASDSQVKETSKRRQWCRNVAKTEFEEKSEKMALESRSARIADLAARKEGKVVEAAGAAVVGEAAEVEKQSLERRRRSCRRLENRDAGDSAVHIPARAVERERDGVSRVFGRGEEQNYDNKRGVLILRKRNNDNSCHFRTTRLDLTRPEPHRLRSTSADD